jgi:hypothetical protein
MQDASEKKEVLAILKKLIKNAGVLEVSKVDSFRLFVKKMFEILHYF